MRDEDRFTDERVDVDMGRWISRLLIFLAVALVGLVLWSHMVGATLLLLGGAGASVSVVGLAASLVNDAPEEIRSPHREHAEREPARTAR